MYRISRPQMYLDIAHIVAKRSTCFRLNVGAVMVKDRNIVSIGYNGAPSGEAHCTGHTCPGWKTGCQRSVHAEDNALMRAPYGVKGMDLYITHSPCSKCFDKLWQSQLVDRIFFGTPFRDTDHLHSQLFDMEVYRVLPSGSVINWETGELINVET